MIFLPYFKFPLFSHVYIVTNRPKEKIKTPTGFNPAGLNPAKKPTKHKLCGLSSVV